MVQKGLQYSRKGMDLDPVGDEKIGGEGPKIRKTYGGGHLFLKQV